LEISSKENDMLEPINDPPHRDFFQYIRLEEGIAVPGPDASHIDVAILDMNHSWPNIGHDALIHDVLEIARKSSGVLRASGLKVRVVSFDIRRSLRVPEHSVRPFSIYIGTGGPGHLDPHLNDGVSLESQGIEEDPSWEQPLFRLFDDIVADPDATLLGVCHTFGLLCRWSGVARVSLRGPEKGGKSSGLPENVLSHSAVEHPWFSAFAGHLRDGRTFRVLDSRLFDLIPEKDAWLSAQPMAFEFTPDGSEPGEGVTMIEFARDPSGTTPRVFAVNHHPEIVDREHVMTVLDEKYARGEVTRQWYEERANTLTSEMAGDGERASRLTSEYTLIGLLDESLRRLLDRRAPDAEETAPLASALS
jgi:hypothetical protein